MKLLVFCLALACSASTLAHDTWFEPLSRNERGDVALALGTGDKFPQHEVAIGPDLVQGMGCLGNPQNKTGRLRHLRSDERSASYRAATGAAAGQALSCWMQMHPVELQVAHDKAELYLQEIGASAELRAKWAAMRARGLTWQERYVKTARHEWAASGGVLTTLPVNAPMDVLMSAPRQPIQVGDVVTLQVLRDGAPLADLPVELRNDQSPISLWRRTDAQGRVTLAMPLAARWMLRGTDLRVADHNADFWESRFITLTFEVHPQQP